MKRIWQEIKEYKVAIIIAFVGIALTTLVEVLLPKLFSGVVTLIKSGTGNDEILSGIYSTGIKMIIIVFIAILGGVIGNYCAAHINTNLEQKLRRNLFNKIQTFSIEEFNQFSTGSLMTRSTNDITNIQNFVGMFIRIFIRAPIMMVGGILMTVDSNVKLALPIVFAAPILVLIVYIIFKTVVPKFTQMQKSIDKINLVLREQITGVRVVRAFVNESYEEERFDGINKENTSISNKTFRIMTAMQPAFTLIMNISIIAVILIAAREVLMAQTTGISTILEGDVMASVQYVTQILASFIMMSMIFVMYPRAEASARRIYEVMDTEPSVQDLKTTQEIKTHREPVLELKKASFSFEGAENCILEGIDLKIEKGTTTAIVGGTGSGKSTLLKLMLRMYDVTQGIVLFHGNDVREIAQKELRQKIGYAPQQAFLFSGTVAENIRYGRVHADGVEIKEALRIANALDFVEKKDDGINAKVAKAGSNFSGGQKQRLSIARAVVGRPELVVFDDSFSALDAQTDKQVRGDINKQLGDSAKIIVAQKISSILDADNIVVLSKGRIVGQGKHDELIKTCEIYKEIAQSQFTAEVEVTA